MLPFYVQKFPFSFSYVFPPFHTTDAKIQRNLYLISSAELVILPIRAILKFCRLIVRQVTQSSIYFVLTELKFHLISDFSHLYSTGTSGLANLESLKSFPISKYSLSTRLQSQKNHSNYSTIASKSLLLRCLFKD